MTPQALLREIECGSEDSVVGLLAGASETQRKGASAAVIERCERGIEPYLQQGLTAAQARRVMFQWAGINRKLDHRPQLALIGTGTFGEIKRYGVGLPSKTYDVLAVRKPKWLEQWCKWVLGVNQLGWPVVRRLVREGLCERPDTDEYYLLMLHGRPFGAARQLLESDPALLEHEVWELFRRQGIREASLAQDFGGWSDALVALSAEGRISRERLLDASLEALELPFKPYHTTWYRNFHEALKPTIDERATRLPMYLALSSSSVPATLKFALKAIETMEKAGALPLEALLDSAGPALIGKQKGAASTVLRLLERAVASSPACRERVAELAAAALEHPAAEIQTSAFELLQRIGPATGNRKALIAPKLELASAPVRRRAEQWLDAGNAIEIEVERYTPSWSMPDPLVCESTIEPIADVEELVLTMTRVMNQGGPPDDVERVLDGVSQLCAERPPRFDDLTSPLRNQISKILAADYVPRIAGVFSVEWLITQLAAAWLHEKMAIKLGDGPLWLHAALGVRPYWVAARAKRKKARGLLSAPTHAGGWIDPVTLVERLIGEAPAEPDEFEADLIQALFRVAPTRRKEALDAARDLRGESGDVVRYALGSGSAPRGQSALWLAAAEARKPGHCEYRLRWDPDKWNPPALKASMIVQPEPMQDVLMLGDLFASDTQPFKKAHFSPDWTATDPLLRAGSAVPDLLAWASLVWPSNREGWCALGAFRIANNLDWDSADWSNRVFLAVFEDRYCEMGRMAHLLLALGLMAREATEFDRARDGLVRIIGDGRLNCDRLGAALAELFANGVVRGARLAKALTETARVSARHADAVRQVIESALGPGLPARPADQSALLEAFLEACTASGAGPASGDLRRLLESVSGSGKGPKLARSLLTLQF